MSIASLATAFQEHPPSNTVGEYIIGPEIGKGSFANVYKGVGPSGHPVAIKSVFRLRLKSKKLVENLEVEISILKNLKHPHIVSLLDCQKTATHFHLIMEYCSLGDLSYFIRRRDQLVKTHPLITSILERYPSPLAESHGLNKTLVIHYLQQLSSALEFLRDKNLVHRDIKPQNLLLSPPLHSRREFDDAGYAGLWELPVLKIADFGFARFLPLTSLAETLCGSPLYMAPEILRYEKYNAKADLWSVGAVLYEMAVGRPPFRASNHVELLKKIEKAKDKISFPLSFEVPEDITHLIRALLKCNPTERMSFQEFFTDPVITYDLSQDSIDEPLEKQADENLFISEYISPLREKTPVQTYVPKHSGQPKPEGRHDEEIKMIITKNSPAPEPHTYSPAPDPRAYSPPAASTHDLVIEKDYVVVEKRAIEVNALADELAHAGSGAVAISRESQEKQGRRASFADRRLISISPTNALTKALGLASNRLFGVKVGDGKMGINISPPAFATNFLHLQAEAAEKAIATGTEMTVSSPKEADEVSNDSLVAQLESLATKAHAVGLFAEVKFSQLIPSPPSSDTHGKTEEDSPEYLPPPVVKTIAEEGVVLYLKNLSLLAKAMQIASQWWQGNQDPSPTSPKLNELVQWIRERFNESLEKAEYIRIRLAESNDALGLDSVGSGSFEHPRTKIVAEKLIFDRALEMSRNAAVNELVNDDLKGCELAYLTSIWMLEALLDEDPNMKRLDKEDRAMIEKFIVSIGNRLNVLKKKIDDAA
ncbi:hypothetical protein BABINDRAFT_159398 [Babjeviella inositovora NRRL Y-12698]|uniref:Serine/threonine-protein kinase ATG1 n=1 Tax=Babjeviella inositovora NRRL Y-12698 TaxID=984486 RepID=A0A1E3QZ39_9ASCO|nr:uncharacterized protein BABINDRAFT_159398 [Babjeviella inositovora NRRL Y-12698]ODQ82906.1 hypothetical protein BABINDRAFT_159398 [Babjeviella inositovora NRRL Y-12698]